MVIEIISPIARNLVPIGLVMALVIFAAMALKGKTLRSLRAQLSIFVLVWIAAELPRSLIVSGFIRASPELTTFGLLGHTISMIVFGVILVYRFYRLPVGRSQLLKAVDEGLREVLGESGAKAVKFYVEPSIATTNIAQYTKSLRKLFAAGAETLERRIAAKLYESVGLQFVEKAGYDLAQYVKEAQMKRVT